jgi:hypothetical protein
MEHSLSDGRGLQVLLIGDRSEVAGTGVMGELMGLVGDGV